MKVSGLSRYSLCLSVGVAMLAGCGGSQPPIGTPLSPRSGALPTERAHPDTSGFGTVFSMTESGKVTVLRRFGGGSEDGANPYAGLIAIGGTLYGTTESGGANNAGTVFAIAASGAETVLHSFGGSGDGDDPLAGLVNVNGTLYGTTLLGGASNKGTIFSITPSGTETVIHSFTDYPDGALPGAGLLDVKGTLYGTTRWGGNGDCVGSYGAFGCGTVFKTTPSGKEAVIYNFDGSQGAAPETALINVNGTLYGGANDEPFNGMIFKISTSGKESIVYKFPSPAKGNGAIPFASLFNLNGTLYGTTREGGIRCNHSSHACGTVYSLTLSGSEKVLHRFAGSKDGAYPFGSLINVNGTLYGTTTSGGVSDGGTLFAITTSGKERVVHTFRRQSGGTNPYAGLLNVKGTLYGTTLSGGAN